MKTLLVLLALVMFLPGGTAAKGGAAWRAKSVVVYDHTSPEWQPYVAETVAAFNAMLPSRAPRLVYTPMRERPCTAMSYERGEIAVCFKGNDNATAFVVRHRVIHGALVRLIGDDPPDERGNVICHEFMHALTGVPDDYDFPHEETSCVQGGGLNAPGAWDVFYARKMYRKYGHDSGPRDRARGKH